MGYVIQVVFEAKANCIDRMTHFLSRVGRIHDPQYCYLLYYYLLLYLYYST